LIECVQRARQTEAGPYRVHLQGQHIENQGLQTSSRLHQRHLSPTGAHVWHDHAMARV